MTASGADVYLWPEVRRVRVGRDEETAEFLRTFFVEVRIHIEHVLKVIPRP
jgi:hypothetical protein